MNKTDTEALKRAIESDDLPAIEAALPRSMDTLANLGDNLELAVFRGIALAKTGRLVESSFALQAAVRLDPSSFLAAYWLSIVYKRAGRSALAADWALRAAQIEPENSMARERLGYAYIGVCRFAEAAEAFRRGLKIGPPTPSLNGGLGLALRHLGQAHDACCAFRRCLGADPGSFPTHVHLATCLAEEGEGEEAVKHAKIALKLRPSAPEGRYTLANALIANGNAEEAERQLQLAIEAGTDDPTAIALSGQVKQVLGRPEDALRDYKRALELDPLQPQACLGFAHSHYITRKDQPFIERLERAVLGEGLSTGSKSLLHYALGKAHEDLGLYEQAMSHFDSANIAARILKFGDAPFEPDVLTGANDRLMESLLRALPGSPLAENPSGEGPVLVIGMMRSGTTLTEQILSSHREIGGAGEQHFWSKYASLAFENDGRLAAGRLLEISSQYCAILASKAPGKQRVVDKMPGNHCFLPLIHLALPGARFIHVRRHPLDTCISIWSTRNTARVPWSHNKENIVFGYQEYLRFMSAWRKVLPPGVMLEIDYEELVSDQERVTRSMISFLGLCWDDACLRPHERRGAVTTPSSWQVRQPVHKKSVGRWHNYEPWLGGFRQLLTEEDRGRRVEAPTERSERG